MPRYVPFALPPEIAVAENCARERVVVAIGTPLMMNAAEELVLLPPKTKTPEPVAFTKKKLELDAVFTESVLADVPVALVKASEGNTP